MRLPSLESQLEGEAVFAELLRRADIIDPRLREKLEEKFRADRAAFIAAATEASKDKTPRDWARKSCNRCHGTGYVGRRAGKDLICRCAEKNYTKWLQEFRLEYVKENYGDKSND